MSKTIGVGIIGCGKITETRHAPEYAANATAKIIGYFDFVKERAEALAARSHPPRLFHYCNVQQTRGRVLLNITKFCGDS